MTALDLLSHKQMNGIPVLWLLKCTTNSYAFRQRSKKCKKTDIAILLSKNSQIGSDDRDAPSQEQRKKNAIILQH